MTAKQWKRLDVVARVADGELSAAQGAGLLRMSVRNFRRLRRRVEKAGNRGVLHKNAGTAPWNKLSEADAEKIVRLARTTYEGFNDQHLTEKLAEEADIKASRSTVRRRLRCAGLPAVKKRRPQRHRRRRDRKAQEGLMLLWDGSRHDWLEARGPRCTLVAAIDDATGQLMPGAHFVDQECSASYIRVLHAIVKSKGVPLSIYMDRHGSLRKNDKGATVDEQLTGRREPTQVGRAIEALGITPIYALSPQAKGRVERLWGTLQDRLTSELRLAKVSTIEEANAFLARYIAAFNRRFAIPASSPTPAWRDAPVGQRLDLICAFHYEIVVGNDNAVRMGSLVVDIPPGPLGRSFAKATVDLTQTLDGSWRVFYKGALIAKAPRTATSEFRIAAEWRRMHPGRYKTANRGSHGYQAYAP